MPCPHNEITIVQRSQRQSAVAAAAYQSGEKLFCEYDQQVKHYPEKRGIVHNEILLPANAPRSYADRNTLWNAAEAVEKQWNSQLARRWVLTIPREIPPDQYFDEFHVLLRDPLTASYFVAVWKMLRKKGCVPSALTQNVKDLLASREIENILDNTDFMILLSQAQSDRAILARQLGISEHQLSYITHSNSGEGLLFYGNVTIPFVDRFPKGEIYDLLTTRPEDMKNEAKTE